MQINSIMNALYEIKRLDLFFNNCKSSECDIKTIWDKHFIQLNKEDFTKALYIELDKMGLDSDNISHVALMRSIDWKYINDGFSFHNAHMDSRKVKKVLVILQGDEKYPIFSFVNEKLDFLSEFEISLRRFILKIFEIKYIDKLTYFRNFISHDLSTRLKRQAKEQNIVPAIPGNVVVFDNMRPHFSHPTPSTKSLLLQVVYK